MMRIGELIELESRENSSMASTWTEYLCLSRLADETFELSVRTYDVLGAAADYVNEETGDWDLSETIEGAFVMGVEDEWVIGGELVDNNGKSIEFQQFDRKVILDFLESVDWLAADVWLAHGIHITDQEIMRLGTAGVGISH
ncbi:MAG: hypothetical protein JSU96_00785, partial [Acidobacteriota bacterium]